MKEMAVQPSILAWRISQTEEPGGATVPGVSESQTQLSDFHFHLFDLSVHFGMWIIMKLQTFDWHHVLGWAAITKYYRLGGFKNINLLSCSSGGWESKIRVPAWLGSGKSSLPDL